MYDPDDMPLPVRSVPLHPELQNIRDFFHYDDHFDERKTKEALAAYYGLTSFMDDCVGKVLRALEESSQAENTVVLYVSDHGDMMGDQGFWTKQVMYEASAGVPMIAAGPNVPIGREIATCTSLTDIAATAKEIADLAQSSELPGKSLRNIANETYDKDRTGFSEYHDGGSKTGAFMVRWGDWKYVHYVGHRPQLFNLTDDPNELIDLASGSSREIKEALIEGERRLRAICDPEEVNARAFSDQRKKIAELGGEEACRTAFVFNHTPTPTEQAKLAEEI